MPRGPGSLVWREARRDTLILLAILLLATGLRVHRLNEQSFWVDEFATAQHALGRGYAHHHLPRNVLIEHPPDQFDLKNARPLHALWYSEVEGHVPPLYLVVTRLWGECFGLGQASLRAMSVVFSVAAVALLFVVVRDLSGAAAGLWAALIMALAGPQIQYAQEARNYSLLLLEGLGAAAALVRIETRGPSRPREVALVLCVLAMALTHYFSLGAILALAVYAAVRLRGPALRRVTGCFVVAALLWCVLGAPLALRQFQNRHDPRATSFLGDDRPGHAARTLARFAALPVRFITEPMSGSTAIAAAGGVVFVLALLLPLRRRDLLFWSLWLWLTVLPLLALDFARRTQHLEFVRYTLLASPALYAILAALLVDHRKRWMRHLPPALAALSCALALPAAYSAWWKADWRALARQIDQHARPGDVVVFWGYDKGGDYSGDPNATFCYTSFYRRKPLGPIILMDAPPGDAEARMLKEAGGVLVVSAGTGNANDIVPGATVKRIAFEPAAGTLWRVETSTAATTRAAE